MTSITAGARTLSTDSATLPARSFRRGLVIENLDALPEVPVVLFSICALTRVTGPVAPTAGRLGA
ncbi:hypothetical protein AB0P12_08455 [Streptomyces subrutilus]|uniref:Uncharacterized protein n=1 Tax=Streptomyces subrutilus TaxID=36818 RepID=A0A5P2UKS8_9ACTN|nr:hypothetical protein [Streptomyces subrutilus]QEU79738.1 hypothetical protein CP968_16625 [Streptomyces subrutilus]WSJ31010.1 hypothetical protein OG479_17980 [Streptomyces subrutilus]GGZ67923.1 hypothetical protein GCM10010371_29830 [Streptomyces subrutilus]